MDTYIGKKSAQFNSPSNEGVILPIQYLRGLAAMSVVLFHSFDKTAHPESAASVSILALAGVNLFFVISGFIMWVTTANKPVTPRTFMVRRIIRIVPLYWFVTLLVVACKLIPGVLSSLRISTAAVLQSLLFIPYDSITFPGHIWPVVEPGWSLNYEMFFYILFALSLVLAVRTRLIVLLGVMIALSLIGEAFGPFRNPIISTYTSTLLLEFSAGVAIAYFWLRGELRLGWALSLVAVAAGFCLMLTLRSNGANATGAALVVLGSLNPVIGKLRSRVLLNLGNASYSIYLTHTLALGLLGIAWTSLLPHPSRTSETLFTPIALIACAIVGWLCYTVVERPITVYLHRLTRAPRTVGPRVLEAQNS
jgi:exopolysaccharide production protein ExoZ